MTAPTWKIVASAVLGAGLLSGCFMEVEGDSVSIQRQVPDACGDPTGATCGKFRGIPADLQTPTVLALASNLNSFVLDVGSQEFLVPRKEFGPVTLDGTLSVNRATVTMNQPGAGKSFASVETLQLWQLPDAACTGACQEVMLAQYVRPAGGAPDPNQLVLDGTGANALELAHDGRFTLQLRATGQVPTVDWNGVVTLDGHLKAKANFP